MNDTKEINSKNIEGYLEIVFETQFESSGANGEAEKLFKPLESMLEDKLDSEDYYNAYDYLWSGFNEIVRRAGIAGMKLAIGIENGTYGAIL